MGRLIWVRRLLFLFGQQILCRNFRHKFTTRGSVWWHSRAEGYKAARGGRSLFVYVLDAMDESRVRSFFYDNEQETTEESGEAKHLGSVFGAITASPPRGALLSVGPSQLCALA